MISGITVLVAAVLVVLGTSVLKTASWAAQTKNTVAGILSILAGVATVVVESGGDFASFGATGIVGTVLMIYGAATAIYKFLMPKSADDFLEQNVGNKA